MADTVRDPICGMQIHAETSAASEVHEGKTFYFCSQGCRQAFLKDPHRYGHRAEEHGGHGEQHAHH